MTLNELSHDEQVALAALMEIGLMANGRLEEREAAQVDEIADALGEELFRKLLDEAESRFPDREGLKPFLATVTRQEARELIFETVLSDALADIPSHAEAEFLDWLAKAWQVSVRVDEQSPPA
jgi:hypothetical protein